MQKFGYMTVKGNWNNRPSGIYTFSAEYPDDSADLDIYQDMLVKAGTGRANRWQSSSTSHTVIGAGIVLSLIGSKIPTGHL